MGRVKRSGRAFFGMVHNLNWFRKFSILLHLTQAWTESPATISLPGLSQQNYIQQNGQYKNISVLIWC